MRILVGVTSGISIYKTLTVIRRLVRSGHQVRVLMTKNAAEFIRPVLFQTLSKNPVWVDEFDRRDPLAHITLADWCEVFAVVPATANTVAKLANGIADNLLTSTALACQTRKIAFPAMNVKMYENPITGENLRKLREAGWTVVEPEEGDLACGYNGRGRLPDEDTVASVIARDITAPLSGRRYIVTAGATRERLDPVRFVSNFSSGRMGVELARALYRRGAEVLLIAASVSVPLPGFLPSVHVESTLDLLDALRKNIYSYDGLFMAAAPADYRAENVESAKIHKTDELTLKLVKNPDILAAMRAEYPDKFLVGFALETDDGLASAKMKLETKGLDFIVLNMVTPEHDPMGSDQNRVRLLSADGRDESLELSPKQRVGEWIVERTLGLSGGKEPKE